MARTLLRVLLVLAIAAVGTVVILVLASRLLSDTDVEAAKVSLGDLQSNRPAPSARRLTLVAGDVDSCSGGEATDIAVEETGSEVLIRASLRVKDTFACEPALQATRSPSTSRPRWDNGRSSTTHEDSAT